MVLQLHIWMTAKELVVSTTRLVLQAGADLSPIIFTYEIANINS